MEENKMGKFNKIFEKAKTNKSKKKETKTIKIPSSLVLKKYS